MTTAEKLGDVLERAKDWPEALQEELIEVSLAIESQMEGTHQLTAKEEVALQEGIKAADEGRFATKDEVQRALSEFRT